MALRSDYHYSNEGDGQADFFREFNIDPEVALVLNTDGVWRGNLLEFKVAISDVNRVLFQAIKYLAKLRVNGRNVPANILLIDLNAQRIYVFDSADYFAEIHQPYTTAASRSNEGFRARSEPLVIEDFFKSGAGKVSALLRENGFIEIEVTEDCVVAWAERYYREVPGSNKESFLANDPRKGALGELKQPTHFKGLIRPYAGDDYEAFAHILDRLNDKLKKIELGAFYTPRPYVLKSHELLREAIARVPAGNDYVIIDRCAGTGNLEEGLTEDELSHVIVNTFEQFEYLELVREYGDRVRAVIPPTYKAGEPRLGVLLNGDALSDRFVLGVEAPDGTRIPNAIQQYVDDPTCTIILFENPPYADTSGMEAQVSSRRTGGRESFGWKSSFVRKEMDSLLPASANGSIPSKELANVFIWSAFHYYLRQPTDSYIVFSPAKYFNQHHLVTKKFLRGFLFNRRHFHATKDAGITVVHWSNEEDPARESFELEMFDIDKTGSLVPGAVKAGWQEAGNVDASGPVPTVALHKVHRRLSTLFDRGRVGDEERGIACTFNGQETDRKPLITLLTSPDIIGFLVAEKMSFDNADLATILTRVGVYNGTGGFYLRRSNYLSKLPLFAVGRYPSEGRFWIRGVVNRCADNGDNFSHDREFLKACLIFTALAYHNKCRSFLGSDGRTYLNELCFDAGTQASKDLQAFTLTAAETELLDQWGKVLELARRTANYDPEKTYGTFQIESELNTSQSVLVGRKVTKVFDYPVLNGELRTLRAMTMAYHADSVAPKLWQYGLLK
ncbi:hypothetical protein Bequi_09850 [Brachybacterium sp. JHP9]|uniref:Uncharacterized protein n=1 Tax=Brachybacterium equifaecis TaxID=2910770 RepID=A0ABT0R1B5_9MICO|nr:hypothetical protein [Brachybacterium equifaecis]MCL6423686.1 hypothetical protein [Brachybacterium equifaecis]